MIRLAVAILMWEDRPDLWNSKVWIEELIELRKHLGLDEIHLLGQSWGGMQTLEYVCNYKPEGLKSIILSSTLPASWLWAARGTAYDRADATGYAGCY